MRFKDTFFQNSKCKNSYLHRFEIVGEYENGVLEVCQICFKRKFFKLIENKVDNQYYMAYHLKSALPPFHPSYERQHENQYV